MPEPRKGESTKKFIKRCIPAVIEKGTAKDPKQGYAICRNMAKKR